MNKKGKKKTNMFEEDMPKKSNFLDEGDFLDKNKMDPTKFLSFLPLDYITSLKPDQKEYQNQFKIFRKIYIDFKMLLNLTFSEFWSTLSFN